MAAGPSSSPGQVCVCVYVQFSVWFWLCVCLLVWVCKTTFLAALTTSQPCLWTGELLRELSPPYPPPGNFSVGNVNFTCRDKDDNSVDHVEDYGLRLFYNGGRHVRVSTRRQRYCRFPATRGHVCRLFALRDTDISSRFARKPSVTGSSSRFGSSAHWKKLETFFFLKYLNLLKTCFFGFLRFSQFPRIFRVFFYFEDHSQCISTILEVNQISL